MFSLSCVTAACVYLPKQFASICLPIHATGRLGCEHLGIVSCRPERQSPAGRYFHRRKISHLFFFFVGVVYSLGLYRSKITGIVIGSRTPG